MSAPVGDEAVLRDGTRAEIAPRAVALGARRWRPVLAALRYWQQDLADNEEEGPIDTEHFNETVTPLTVEEIDTLCERLNCGDSDE